MVVKLIRTQRGQLRALWLRIHEPRVVSVLRFVMYLVMLAGGCVALVFPPISLGGPDSSAAATGMATLIVFGSSLGAIAVLPGAWWLERTALLAIGIGLALWWVAVLFRNHATLAGSVFLLCMISALALSQVIRWVRIQGPPYDKNLRPPSGVA